MDGTTLQQKLYEAYALAAARIGLPYQLFRASSALNPLAGPPLASLSAAFSPGDYRFAKPQDYAKACWQCLADGSRLQVFDLLVGPKTYFIAAMQPALPILAVEAPRLVDIRRPFRQTGVGFGANYGGTTPAQETTLLGQWPASILEGARGETSAIELPDDVRSPWWGVLMPAWPGVEILSSDVIKDDLGRRFTVSSAELSPLGWRLTALQSQA